MKDYKILLILISSIICFSCEFNNKSRETPQKSETVNNFNSQKSSEIKYIDTIPIDYLENKRLLNILKILPKSAMSSWEWSKKDRERTVEFIKKNNFIIDTTKMYHNIKYIKPNTIGIEVVDGFWTLSIYKFNENDWFIITNDIVGDGNDIRTYNFKTNKLIPTKIKNWFSKFDSKLLSDNSTNCIELMNENKLNYEYDFKDESTIKISSWSLNKNNFNQCFNGNSIEYKLNKSKKTFDISKIFWEENNNE